MKKKSLVGLLGAILLSPAFAADVSYPLRSTVDSGMGLQETKAANARKLAEYVTTKENVLHYKARDDSTFQNVRAVLFIKNWLYTLEVINYNEQPGEERVDSLEIHMQLKGKPSEEVIILYDKGLDGNCNSGTIPKKFSGSLNTEVVYQSRTEEFPQGVGLEHRERVQRMCEATMEQLLRFYEQRKG